MIVGNISTFEGQCADAEHFYCRYIEIENYVPKIHALSTSHGEDLQRIITDEAELKYLERKDGYCCLHIGSSTGRFQTIEQIHEALIAKFPNQDIITYDESRIFKDMLYIKDGVNVGVKFFGDVWLDVPRSVYMDLLPDKSTIKVKCDDCGQFHELDEIAEETAHMGRPLLQFMRKSEIDKCCNYCNLMWNVIL
ncbi:MAG: hypothetical protein WC979_02935 [Candidatus Pacearchaeota archaeon]|jgi:hypothetical protein|nr:hypothetical protein [Clostridia bacterium]